MITATVHKTSTIDGTWVPVRIFIENRKEGLIGLTGKITIQSKGLDDEGNLHDIENPQDIVRVEHIDPDHVLRSGATVQSFMNDFAGLAEDIRNKVVGQPPIIEEVVEE